MGSGVLPQGGGLSESGELKYENDVQLYEGYQALQMVSEPSTDLHY